MPVRIVSLCEEVMEGSSRDLAICHFYFTKVGVGQPHPCQPILQQSSLGKQLAWVSGPVD